MLLAVVCLYFCTLRISTRPALGVPECAGVGGEGREGAGSRTHHSSIFGHFHGSLKVKAQAMSCGLHHLPRPRSPACVLGKR